MVYLWSDLESLFSNLRLVILYVVHSHEIVSGLFYSYIIKPPRSIKICSAFISHVVRGWREKDRILMCGSAEGLSGNSTQWKIGDRDVSSTWTMDYLVDKDVPSWATWLFHPPGSFSFCLFLSLSISRLFRFTVVFLPLAIFRISQGSLQNRSKKILEYWTHRSFDPEISGGLKNYDKLVKRQTRTRTPFEGSETLMHFEKLLYKQGIEACESFGTVLFSFSIYDDRPPQYYDH